MLDEIKTLRGEAESIDKRKRGDGLIALCGLIFGLFAIVCGFGKYDIESTIVWMIVGIASLIGSGVLFKYSKGLDSAYVWDDYNQKVSKVKGLKEQSITVKPGAIKKREQRL